MKGQSALELLEDDFSYWDNHVPDPKWTPRTGKRKRRKLASLDDLAKHQATVDAARKPRPTTED
jgi:hypothetical protein